MPSPASRKLAFDFLRLDESIQALVEGIRDSESDHEIDSRVDNALAQFFEVFYEAHAGKFGAGEG